jgi:subtilisin family serine protease
MDPLSQIRLQSLMNISSGNPDITIGLIDGPLDYHHPAFQGSRIRAVSEFQVAVCKNASSIACRHSTFVAGILCAKRGSAAPAICPDCTLLLRPIFRDQTSTREIMLPTSTPEELSDAIIEVVDAQARIINLSLGLSSSSLMTYPRLQEAYDYARQHGVIIIAASGNQGNIGSISLVHNEWVIPVVACDENGLLHPMSNFGPSIGSRGLMAPGINISSTRSGGEYLKMSGTSFAAPFVTGIAALLWSISRKATASQIVYALRSISTVKHLRIFPPLVNADKSMKILMQQ